MAAAGKYERIRSLAVGGMGEIFLARQKGPAGFSRLVVLKQILKHLAADPSFVEQFLNEGRLAARVAHPNVVQILELGESDDGGWFLALEYIHGVSLRSVGKRLAEQGQRFPLPLAAWIAAQALHGLHAAHELRDEQGRPLGLVHRDVSPDNLMLGYSGAVKLLDFGVAKATATVSSTRPGTLKGKLAYLAPEVISGDLTTRSTDLYAMGVVLYELAAGRRPFVAENEGALLNKVLEEVPVPLRQLAPAVEPELASIVERALAKDPATRFPTALAMAEALERYASSRELVTTVTLTAFMGGLYGSVPEPTVEVQTRGTVTLERPDAAKTTIDSALTRRPSRWRALLAAAVALGVTGLTLGALTRPVRTPAAAPASPVLAAALAPAAPDAGNEERSPDTAPDDVASAPPTVDAGTPAAPPAQRLGRVVVQVQPWAEVYLGTRRLGVTPIAPFSLPPGNYQLLLRNPQLGVERKMAVHVAAGATSTVRASLARE